FALFAGFANAQHGRKATCLSRSELANQNLIAFAHNLATLRMPYEDQTATCISQLTRRYFTGQRTLPCFMGAVLRTNRNRLALQTINHQIDVQTRRKYRDINTARESLCSKALDQLSDAGAGTVHLPVTSYHRATHAVPRRSKWAQMLPNSFNTGKPKSGANFCNQLCKLVGIGTNLSFILTFHHHANQWLSARLAQQHATATGHRVSYTLASLLDRRMLHRVHA